MTLKPSLAPWKQAEVLVLPPGDVKLPFGRWMRATGGVYVFKLPSSSVHPERLGGREP